MYNKAQVIGRLGSDPEIRFTQEGKAVATISLATTESWKDKVSGERKEKTEWHRVILFGKLAEIARDYLKKGALTLFEGPVRTRKWQDQSGQDRYSTEIHATEMKMLGGKPNDSSGSSSTGSSPSHSSSANASSTSSQSNSHSAPPAYDGPAYDDFDDDIPF